MDVSDRVKAPIRMAVLTLSISHFEVPLFRLCSQAKDLQLKVFYLLPVKSKSFDSEYSQEIDWGSDLLGGYESSQVDNWRDLDSSAREWGADAVLIYGYGWPGAPQLILQNWWRGQPQIHRGTLNYYLDPRRPIRGRIMRPLGRFLLSLFDAHHYGGDYSRKVLLDAGVKKQSLFFVPYSIDTPYFLAVSEQPEQLAAAKNIRESQGWSQDAHVLLFIAQHNWFKGPDIAMEVFSRMAEKDPKARFLVVGAGRMTGEMKNYAQRYLAPGSICFAGFVPSAQTISYYLASDLVICTSRYETWARMVNEAMLCRRPCLVSQIVPSAGGLIEDSENGYVVEKLDVDQFVVVIKRHFAMTDSEKEIMGEAAREKAKLFAYEPHMKNVEAAARYSLEKAK